MGNFHTKNIPGENLSKPSLSSATNCPTRQLLTLDKQYIA